MTFLSLAAWVVDAGTLPRSFAGDRGADFALRRLLAWAAPAGVVFAALAIAGGAALRDRPTALGALVLVAAVVLLHLLLRGLATRMLVRLDAAVAEREALMAELDASRTTKDELRNRAYHDELTGLPNRSLLYDRLGLAITQSFRQRSHLALLFLDVDDFKAVNDSLGHSSGDRVLMEVATRVRGSVRTGDTVARFGGDEFVVLLNDVTGAEDAGRVAVKVLEALRAPFGLDGHEVSITASLGVSVYPIDGTSPDELLKSADAAMYGHKQREATVTPNAACEPLLAPGLQRRHERAS
jgi:diguanylate cyclase (GGDEF)-like protein